MVSLKTISIKLAVLSAACGQFPLASHTLIWGQDVVSWMGEERKKTGTHAVDGPELCRGVAFEEAVEDELQFSRCDPRDSSRRRYHRSERPSKVNRTSLVPSTPSSPFPPPAMPPTAPRAMLQTPFLDLTTEDTYPVASTSTLPRPDDPLVTLRAAALQSKKRKAEAAQAKADKKKKKAESTSEVIVLVDSDDEELEEGEMREVTPLEGETKPLLGAMDVDDQYAVERDSRVFGLGVPPLGPRSSLGRANSFPLPGPQYLPLGPSRADGQSLLCSRDRSR